MRLRTLAGLVLIWAPLVGCKSSSVPSSGVQFGNGRCSYPPLQGRLFEGGCMPPGQPNGCGEPLCGASPGDPPPRVGYSGGEDDPACRASYQDDIFGTMMLDPAKQKRDNLDNNQLFSACKYLDRCTSPSECSMFQVAPIECGALAYFNGFTVEPVLKTRPDRVRTRPFGGNTHDGDRDFNGAPFDLGSMGIQGSGADGTTRIPMDLREVTTSSNMHLEVPWCRWFGAPITIPADAEHQEVNFCTFQPNAGERISVVGDWIVDDTWTEIHDARVLVAVRPDRSGMDGCSANGCMTDQAICLAGGPRPITCANPATTGCGNPNLWHLLASAYFGRDTAQQDEINVTVPIPSSTEAGLTKLEHDIPDLAAYSPGCRARDLGISVNCDKDAEACSIQLRRNGGVMSVRSCISSDICPCTNRHDVIAGNCNPQDNWASLNACEPNGDSKISFAKDVRVVWKDPMDAWQCECAFEDPSTPGGVIIAPVQGCATHGREDDILEDIRKSCAEVCAGSPRICSGAPACRIEAARSTFPAGVAGFLLAQNACEEAPGVDRVSPTGDFRVELSRSSSIIKVGELDPENNLTEKARTRVGGPVFLSVDPGAATITISELRVRADDFTVPGFLGFGDIHFSNTTATSTTRASGTATGANRFQISSAHLKIAVVTTVDDARGTTVFLNQGSIAVEFDATTGTFSLDGAGADGKGRGVVVHLSGTVVDRPPSASAGPDQVVECEADRAAHITLDARASSDPDGEPVAHFQWFEQASGLGNQSVVSVLAPLGAHVYSLHVYDTKLGSDRVEHVVDVVDTIPPQLSVSPEELCVWPPQHDFALLRVGQELDVSSTDSCDGSAAVTIVSVTSDETVDAVGSGSTSPDAVHGRNAACVRVERSGPGEGRRYSVVVEARDSSNNVTRKTIRLLVPHDSRAHGRCVRADGMAVPDARCTQ